MNFIYKVDKKELRDMFIKDYSRINIFYLVLTTIIFFVATKDILKYNLRTCLLFYLIILLLLIIILSIINRVYANILVNVYKNNCGVFEISIDKKGISINDEKLKWTDIKKINIKKDRIYISYGKSSFIIDKEFLKVKDDFDKIVSNVNH